MACTGNQSFRNMTDEQLRAIAHRPHGVSDWMDSTIQSNRHGAALELTRRAARKEEGK